MGKIIATIIVGALSLALHAKSPLEYASITTVFNDKSEKTERVKLNEIRPNVWRFQIPKSELVGKNINYIDVVSDAAIAKKGEEGYFIFNNNLGRFRCDKGLLTRRKMNIQMLGMKNQRATFAAIIKGLVYEYEGRMEIKDGVYKTYPRFFIEDIQFPAYEDLIVDFHELKNGDADYSGMARTYRKYQLERGAVKPIKERMKDSPSLAYAAKAPLVRFQHGSKPIPQDEKGKKLKIDYTIETELPMRVYWTFDNEMKAISKLHELGVKELCIHDVGWNIRGHDGRFPQLFPVEPSIGGEQKLRDTVKLAQSFGYQINCHTNQTDAYKIADCWSEDYIVKLRDGSLYTYTAWSGGKAYVPCARAVYETFVVKDYPKIRGLGYNGMHHVDVISAIEPRVCHDPNHSLNRKEWVQWQLKATELAHKLFGGFSSECGIDFVARDLDYALYIERVRSNLQGTDFINNPKKGRKNPIVDETVPVWQIAYHGIILYNSFHNDINYSLSDGDVYKIRRNQIIEFGSKPAFYGGTKLRNIHKVKIAYDDFLPVRHLQLEFMQEHKQLAPSVFLTRYSNGDKTVVNYTKEPFSFDGRTVAPLDYILIKAEN